MRSRLRKIFAPPFIVGILAFFYRPSLLGWAELPLPEWLRWLGVILGLASLLLILWVQSALGINFSGTLHLRAEHSLVTHGPYRRVRHPMYTVMWMHWIAILLLTSNWLFGGLFLLAQTLTIALRVRREETLMIDKFGNAYRA